MSEIETEVAVLKTKFDNFEKNCLSRKDQEDKRFEQEENMYAVQFKRIDERFDELKTAIEHLSPEAKRDNLYKWLALVGIIVSIIVGSMAIYSGFKKETINQQPVIERYIITNAFPMR